MILYVVYDARAVYDVEAALALDTAHSLPEALLAAKAQGMDCCIWRYHEDRHGNLTKGRIARLVRL